MDFSQFFCQIYLFYGTLSPCYDQRLPFVRKPDPWRSLFQFSTYGTARQCRYAAGCRKRGRGEEPVGAFRGGRTDAAATKDRFGPNQADYLSAVLLAVHDYGCFYTIVRLACWILWTGVN